ncbi:MAG: signal peptidase I [Jatrophihabitantaceae bacterium]
MAAPEKSPTSSATGSDLGAQIQARIAARRQGGQRTGGHLSVAQLRAAQLNGHRPIPVPAGTSPRRRHAPTPRPPSHLHRLARFVLLLVLTATAVIGLRSFVIASYYIPSASMETTLHGCPHCEPDMVLVDKLSYRFKSISRTDVVVFNRPPLAPPEDKQLIKRVIGLPGDVISGHNGHVYIDNKQLIEPYVNPSCNGTADFAPITVPAGDYFMMGDNRCDSFDSRMFGAIPKSSIVGRAFAVIWPTKHLRWL